MKAGSRIQTATMKTAHVYGAGAERKRVHNNDERFLRLFTIQSQGSKEATSWDGLEKTGSPYSSSSCS